MLSLVFCTVKTKHASVERIRDDSPQQIFTEPITANLHLDRF